MPIDIINDLRPHRDRAAAITASIVGLNPDALDDAEAFFAELDERFKKPLIGEYLAVPSALRAWDDLEQPDAIDHLVTSFAAAWQLAEMQAIAMGVSLSNTSDEMHVAAFRYRELYGMAV